MKPVWFIKYSDLPQIHDRNCIPGKDAFLPVVKSERSPGSAKPSVPRMLLGVSAANYWHSFNI